MACGAIDPADLSCFWGAGRNRMHELDATVTDLTCFKAYDIRGRLGAELNEDIARRVGRAFVAALDARRLPRP